MSDGDEAVIRRAFEFFNRMLEEGSAEERAELGALWADEPEIVPMRAALEGKTYTGPDALDRFREDSLETWSELEVELGEITRPGPGYLVSGALRGRGRESGAEITTPIWFAFRMRDGRIARGATHFDPAAAEAEARRS